MPFRINDAQLAPYPDVTAVDKALADFGLTAQALKDALIGVEFPDAPQGGGGYQQYLATHLERHLDRFFKGLPGVTTTDARYSSLLGEKADLAMSSRSGAGMYVEIEFRPNVEKDLAKFQIGHHAGRLALGVLILATSRNSLNDGYTTMPEYRKFVRVIPEFRPQHPLLLVGIDGERIPDNQST